MVIPPEHAPRIKRTMARMNPAAFAQMIKAMQERECSVHELVVISGLHEWTVRQYCKALVLAQAAHIARWSKDSMGRDVTAHYRLGFGVNVPREKRTGNQRMQDRRKRLREQAAKLNEQLVA